MSFDQKKGYWRVYCTVTFEKHWLVSHLFPGSVQEKTFQNIFGPLDKINPNELREKLVWAHVEELPRRDAKGPILRFVRWGQVRESGNSDRKAHTADADSDNAK